MARKYWIIIAIIITLLLITLVINMLFLADWQLIPTSFSNSEWFSFWSSYITGVFAVIACYYTIQSANKNSKDAIMQQNAILIRQRSDEIYKEITEEVKLQVRLFNFVDFTSILLNVDEDNLPRMKDEVLKKKSSIAERKIHWALLKNLYLNSESVTSLAEEYDLALNSATDKLVEYAKMELDMFFAIEDIKVAEKTIVILDSLLDRLNDKLSDNSNNQETIDLIAQYEKQKSENMQKQYEANKKYKDLVSLLHKSVSGLSASQDVLFNASVNFLGKLGDYVAHKFQCNAPQA
ncbi:MAG: hypothetical protein MJZ27_08855 [Bacteroidales bacterium]|nr:hypothetical protein [Bacteroidales bacterium]